MITTSAIATSRKNTPPITANVVTVIFVDCFFYKSHIPQFYNFYGLVARIIIMINPTTISIIMSKIADINAVIATLKDIFCICVEKNINAIWLAVVHLAIITSN